MNSNIYKDNVPSKGLCAMQSAGFNQAVCQTSPPKEPEILSFMIAIKQQQEFLGEQLLKLQSKIGPVLGPLTPEVNSSNRRESVTELGSNLSEVLQTVNHHVYIVQDLQNRCAL